MRFRLVRIVFAASRRIYHRFLSAIPLHPLPFQVGHKILAKPCYISPSIFHGAVLPCGTDSILHFLCPLQSSSYWWATFASSVSSGLKPLFRDFFLKTLLDDLMVKTDIPGRRTIGGNVAGFPKSLSAGRTQIPALRIPQRARAALVSLLWWWYILCPAPRSQGYIPLV